MLVMVDFIMIVQINMVNVLPQSDLFIFHWIAFQKQGYEFLTEVAF